MKSAFLTGKIFILWSFCAASASLDAGGFLFTAPRMFLSKSSDNNVCIAFKNVTNEAVVEVKILKEKNDAEIASAIENIRETDRGGKCFKVILPRTSTRQGRLQLIIRPTTEDFNINYIEHIYIRPNPDMTFIQTDKSVYTGGQTLKFRIFSLKSNLTPATEPIDQIWIENPIGIRLMQWINEYTYQGIVNKTFQFSHDPFPGKWSIKLKRKYDETISKTFLVQNYVLPRFSVVIQSPKFITNTGNITICAKYFFGQPVHGEVLLEYFIKCSFSYYCQENRSHAARRLKLNQDGCIRYEILLKNLSSFAKRLVINASVIENGTRVKADATSVVDIKTIDSLRLPYFTVSFDTKNRKFKPGLPFKGEIIFSPSLDSQARVNICLEVNEERNCRQLTTRQNHVNFLILPLLITNKNEFTATLEISSSQGTSLKENHRIRLTLVPWYSRSGSYISLKGLFQEPLKCGQNAKIQILYSTPDSSVRFHYMVKSRGVVLESELLDNVDRKSEPFEYDDSSNPINRGDVQNVKQFQFNITVSPLWSPGAHLLVYYIRDDNEIVADTLSMPVEKCLPNQAKVKWGKSVLAPGSKNHLMIETTQNAVCAVTVVDQSINLLSSSSTINYDTVLNKFEFDTLSSQNIRNGYCHKQEEPEESDIGRSMSGPNEMDSQFVDSLHAFLDFGALVITNLDLETRPCRERNKSEITTRNSRINAAEMSIENISVFNSRKDLNTESWNQDEFLFEKELRTYFPETWIWDLVKTNESGVTAITVDVPDSVTEWTTDVICLSGKNGLAIAESSKFTTYKPFFLDFFVPHVLNKREIFHLQVTVFNYETAEIPVRVMYGSSNHFLLKTENTVSYCIRPKSKIIHSYLLQAIKLGDAQIMVSAEIDLSFPGTCGNIVAEKRDTVVKTLTIRHEGFAMENAISGFICGNSTNFGNQIRWNIKVPVDIIDSSISLDALVSGDVLGPSLRNVHRLITLPTGCGEQNMVLLVPNILLLDYLLQAKIGNLELIENALKNLDLGYQKQLNYKRKDHSYSAFGEEDGRGSIWLTAFVVRYLSQAKKYIFVDSKDLNSSVSWIMGQQMENGCFPMIGKIYHRNLQEKVMEEDSLKILSAYIITALIEYGIPRNHTVIKNAIFCLKPSRESLGLYGDLLSAYALISAGEFRDAQALMLQLLKEASRSYGMLWWTDDAETIESSIEMTAYGILTLVKLGGPHFMAAASDALRWIIQHQNNYGGFVSTQDTIVALEALSKFSSTLPPLNEHDHLIIKASTSEKTHTFDVVDSNRMLLQKLHLPSFTTNIQFEGIGLGCALVQTCLKYNHKKGNPSEILKLQLRIHSVSDVSSAIAQFHLCVKYDTADKKIGMAILEIFMVSGYYPDRYSLYDIQTSRKGVRMWEEYEDRVIFYLEDLSRKKICVKFLIIQEACVENTSPALIKIYDYYNTRLQSSMKYNLAPDCNKGTWASPFEPDVKPESIKLLHKVNSIQKFGSNKAKSKRFHGFTKYRQDLDTPSGLEGVIPAYAFPPNPQMNGVSCPNCPRKIPDIFPQLYCSSKVAIKVQTLGNGFMELQLDVSPRTNITTLKRTVSLNLRSECDCTALKSVNTNALILVIPSRSFDIGTIKEINGDDSLQIYPWENSSAIPKYLTEGMDHCMRSHLDS